MATAPSLHVVRLDDHPLRELRYLNAARGGGTEAMVKSAPGYSRRARPLR